MNIYQRYLIQVITIVCITYTLTELSVDRKLKSDWCNPFCESQDYFENEDNSTEFCASRNSTCLQSCTRCKCQDGDVFVSYKHGCIRDSKVKSTLNVTSCFSLNVFGEDILTAIDESLSYNQCSRLDRMSNQLLINCKIKGAYEIDVFDGQSRRILKHPFDIRDRYSISPFQCIGCDQFSCSLDQFAGMLIKLDLMCTDYNSMTNMIPSCFIFKVRGHTSTNLSLTTVAPPSTTAITNSKLEQNDGKLNSSTLIVIVVVACLIKIAISISVVVLCRRHKKMLIKKKSQCAHYVTKPSVDEDVYTQTGNPAYEDLNIKIEPQSEYVAPAKLNYPTKKNHNHKEEENVYYKASELRSNDNENSLYNVAEENVYAESENPNTPKKDEEDSEYTYTLSGNQMAEIDDLRKPHSEYATPTELNGLIKNNDTNEAMNKVGENKYYMGEPNIYAESENPETPINYEKDHNYSQIVSKDEYAEMNFK